MGTGSHRWHAFNSSFDSYWLDFGRLSEAPFVKEAMSRLRALEKPRILDLMSSPAAITLMLPGKGSLYGELSSDDVRGLAVCHPMDRVDSHRSEQDPRINCIYGDLTHLPTLRAIDNWVSDNGEVDLIMSRGGGGLGYTTRLRWRNLVYLRRVHKWLSPYGIALLMIPPSHALIKIGYEEPWEENTTRMLQRIGFNNVACCLDRKSQPLNGTYSVVAVQKETIPAGV